MTVDLSDAEVKVLTAIILVLPDKRLRKLTSCVFEFLSTPVYSPMISGH